jgi:8-oxo-(d)GTP phosphatase
MLIFVNNKTIEIFDKKSKKQSLEADFNQIINLEKVIFEYKDLRGKVLVKNASFENILNFIQFLQSNKIDEPKLLYFEVKDKKEIKTKIKNAITVIKAGGGIVINELGKKLLMKRLGFWDLPKGKAENDETSKETAQREVEEECNISVKVNDKICTTWHTYLLKGKLVIKQTKWYDMTLISDKKMKPQAEEGIEELKWMSDKEVIDALEYSYATIAHVVHKFGLK